MNRTTDNLNDSRNVGDVLDAGSRVGALIAATNQGLVIRLLAMGTLFVLASGCQTGGVHWNKATKPSNSLTKKEKESKFGIPERMVVIWKDSIYEDPSSPPVRGFGGRVFFYDENDQPIRVDGELAVYGFDDTNGQSHREADKKYVFEQSLLQQHFGETGLGPSYSIWVPWDQLGGDEINVSLIPVFRDMSGKLVRGGSSVNVLPGQNSETKRNLTAKDATGNENANELTLLPGVQRIATGDQLSRAGANREIAHISAEETVPVTNRNGVEMRTTTISLPEDTAQRLLHATRQVVNQPHSKPASGGTNNYSSNDQSARNPADDGSTAGVTGDAIQTQNTNSETPGTKRPAAVFGQPGSFR